MCSCEWNAIESEWKDEFAVCVVQVAFLFSKLVGKLYVPTHAYYTSALQIYTIYIYPKCARKTAVSYDNILYFMQPHMNGKRKQVQTNIMEESVRFTFQLDDVGKV